MAHKLIPFWAYPYSWGMNGKTRDIAKAEYELSGYSLDMELLRIRKEEFQYVRDYQRRVLEIQGKYSVITESELQRGLADLIEDSKLKEITILELDYKEGKIKDLEYSKSLATLNNEPWITVLSMDFNKTSSLEGSFELDWNDQFVKKLEAEGYVGISPDVVVNMWFMEVCRTIAMEEFDGTGNFTSDSEANLDTVKRWSATSTVGENHKGYK